MNTQKIAQKWEEHKNKTANLSAEINRCGAAGAYYLMGIAEKKYVAAHKSMKAFAKRHDMLNQYEAWIS